MSLRIFITGSTGLVGSRLVEAWAGRFQLAGCSRAAQTGQTIEHAQLDLGEDPRRIEDLLEAFQPDVLVHTAAVSSPVQLAADPRRGMRVNVEAAHWIAAWCRRRDRLLLAFSSDTVYPDAADPATPAPPEGWHEAGPLKPLHEYGRSKVAMEQTVLEQLPDALLLRSSLLWGRSRPGQNSFSGWLLQRAEQGLEVPVFRDNHRNLLAAGALPEILERVIHLCLHGGESSASLKGPLNLGGEDYLSREAFARLLWQQLDLDEALLRPLDSSDAALGSATPARELPLDLQRLRTVLGTLPTTRAWLPRDYPSRWRD